MVYINCTLQVNSVRTRRWSGILSESGCCGQRCYALGTLHQRLEVAARSHEF